MSSKMLKIINFGKSSVKKILNMKKKQDAAIKVQESVSPYVKEHCLTPTLMQTLDEMATNHKVNIRIGGKQIYPTEYKKIISEYSVNSKAPQDNLPSERGITLFNTGFTTGWVDNNQSVEQFRKAAIEAVHKCLKK